MQIINFKRTSNTANNSAVIVINAIVFLVDFPGDTCEWLLKTIEVLAFFTLLMISWKWRVRPLLRFCFRKCFRPSNFLKSKINNYGPH